MEDMESEAFFLQVMEKHHFRIDEGKTILFGQCEKCYEER